MKTIGWKFWHFFAARYDLIRVWISGNIESDRTNTLCKTISLNDDASHGGAHEGHHIASHWGWPTQHQPNIASNLTKNTTYKGQNDLFTTLFLTNQNRSLSISESLRTIPRIVFICSFYNCSFCNLPLYSSSVLSWRPKLKTLLKKLVLLAVATHSLYILLRNLGTAGKIVGRRVFMSLDTFFKYPSVTVRIIFDTNYHIDT